jgi:hypothetical protein
MSLEAVAAAARRPVAELRELSWDDGFRELVEGWGALMALAPAAREARLLRLAHVVLEDGLAAGDARVAIFVVRCELRRQQAVASLAHGVGRLIARDLARAAADETAREDAAADPVPAEATAEPGAEAGEPAAAQPRAPRPVDPADRLAWQAGAYLRRQLLEEHLLGWRAARAAGGTGRPGDPAAAPPQAADAEPPPEAPRIAPAMLAALLGDATEGAPPSPAPESVRTAILAGRLFGRIVAQTADPTPAFQESLAAALVRLPRDKLEILASFGPQAVRRLMRMADALPRARPPGDAAAGAAMPEGP